MTEQEITERQAHDAQGWNAYALWMGDCLLYRDAYATRQAIAFQRINARKSAETRAALLALIG